MGSNAIRILGRIWRLRTVKKLSADGECDYGPAILRIRAGMSQFDRKDTVLHEIMHAILHMQGRENDPAVEETFVRPLATGIIGVMQDNPELAAWLAAPIRRKPC